MIPFGIANIPVIFMNLMTFVSIMQLDKFVLVIIDDILIIPMRSILDNLE